MTGERIIPIASIPGPGGELRVRLEHHRGVWAVDARRFVPLTSHAAALTGSRNGLNVGFAELGDLIASLLLARDRAVAEGLLAGEDRAHG